MKHRLPRTKFTLIFPWFPRPVINLDMVMLQRPINKKAIINALYNTGIQFIDSMPV